MELNYLSHHGTKGMKWGVRRYQNKDGSLTPAGKKRQARMNDKADKENWSDDARTAADIRTKKVKQMSNAELRKLNERTRLEQEYAQLNKRHKSAGQKFVSDVLVNASKETAKQYVTEYMKKGINYGIKVLKAKRAS
jgi:hypothetical protein